MNFDLLYSQESYTVKDEETDVMKQVMSDSTFPDELIINIHTNIPDHPFLQHRYLFHPLVKIPDTAIASLKHNNSAITTIFTKREQFEQWLRKIAPKANYANLRDATQHNNIDHSIQQMIKLFYAYNQVVTIDNKPFTIGDRQWTYGDWVLHVKPAPLIASFPSMLFVYINKVKEAALQKALDDLWLKRGLELLNFVEPYSRYGTNYVLTSDSNDNSVNGLFPKRVAGLLAATADQMQHIVKSLSRYSTRMIDKYINIHSLLTPPQQSFLTELIPDDIVFFQWL